MFRDKTVNRYGFTLIEMLLATVLMSLLMVGVLAVITRVSGPIASEATPVSLSGIAIDTDAAVRVITADLAQAQEIELVGDAVAIKGHAGLNALTKERNQRPVEVRYLIKVIADQPCLVREERLLDVKPAQAISYELVAVGITGLELEPPARVLVSEVSGGDEDSGEEQALPMDGVWRLKLRDGANQPVVDRPVILRRRLAQ